MQKVHLVIIDPQNDFCDPKGALSVPGADQDMTRLALMIDRIGTKLEDIHVTLDSHHLVDIAHPIFWKDSAGNHPNPFTIITAADIKDDKWTTTNPAHFTRAYEYVKALDANGRYPLCIWPPHCRIGTWGHTLYPAIEKSLTGWEQQFAMVDFVTKGSNIWTEHYSAMKADVPDPSDPTTQINTEFINTLMDADIIAVAGEASSHCVANTVRDIADAAGDDFLKKITLLTDATSPVPGFENLATDFINEMTSRGMKISKTTEFLQ